MNSVFALSMSKFYYLVLSIDVFRRETVDIHGPKGRVVSLERGMIYLVFNVVFIVFSISIFTRETVDIHGIKGKVGSPGRGMIYLVFNL